ncbi:hypothetical protein [Gordonia sp. (in: high G+C Gram-positive bacteria)]|uniref:hypothetical protein n=1 Tax=Gordonia sp. (in: high G+C Gram-positive bacteria) TaxID=84139 RepID=UPI003C7498C6
MTEIQPLTTTDLQPRDAATNVLPSGTPSPGAVAMLMQHAQTMDAAHKLAVALCGTSMVPQAYKNKPDEGAAAILYGAELGLTPVQSLQQIFNVQGKPAIYARTMVALVKNAGYSIQTVESTDEAVTVAGIDPRTGVEEVSTWTIDRARKAGYTSNKKYDTDPQGMLYAKAATEVCRKIAPDVLLGIAYSREELELEQGPVLAPVRRPAKARGVAGARAALGIDVPADAVADEGAAGMASKAQRQELVDLMGNEPGLADKSEALAWLSSQLERAELITSTEQVTATEAAQVIEFLREAQAADKAGVDGQ